MLAYNWTCLAFLVLSAVGLSGLTVNVLKYAIGRARPLYFHDFGVLSLHPFAFDARFAGFPSGHATTMGAVFGVALLLFPRRWYIALAITACIASTRVFVGAHYPSDTVAGFGLGCLARPGRRLPERSDLPKPSCRRDRRRISPGWPYRVSGGLRFPALGQRRRGRRPAGSG